MDHLIFEKVISLAKLSRIVSLDKKEGCLAQAQDILLEHLEVYPRDTDAWLLLTRLECNSPFYDPERIIKYTGAVLSYDKGNIYALLLLAYSDYYLTGSQDDELVDKLSQAKSDDQYLLSLVEIAKARSWEIRNKEEYEKCLLKSIELYKDNTTSYAMLGKFYIKHGKFSEGVPLVKQALLNEKKEGIGVYNPADINGLLKDFFAYAVGVDDRLRDFVKEYENAHQ